jgi:hypothetical protein
MVTAAETPTDAPPPAKTPAIALPPHEDRCASDAECGVTELDLDGPTACCFRCCTAHGGRRSWVKVFEATYKRAPNPDCRVTACACPMPPYVPKCVQGRCSLVYPPR